MESPILLGRKKKEELVTTKDEPVKINREYIDTRIEEYSKKLETAPNSAGEVLTDLDLLQKDFEKSQSSLPSKEIGMSRQKIEKTKLVADMVHNGTPYPKAVEYANKMTFVEQGKGSTGRGMIYGGLIALGLFGAAAAGGLWWYNQNRDVVGPGGEGPVGGTYVKGHQAVDPLIPPAVDKNPLAATEVAPYIGSPQLEMQPDQFFDKVYPNLPPELQNHIVRADMVGQLNDGDWKNDEIGKLFLNKDMAGAMFINYEFIYQGKDGGQVTYLQSPISLTDSQAATIEKAYKA